MRSIQELKAEIESLQQQLDEARERDRGEAVERVRELCKDFDITPSMLKGYLVDGRSAPRKKKKSCRDYPGLRRLACASLSGSLDFSQ